LYFWGFFAGFQACHDDFQTNLQQTSLHLALFMVIFRDKENQMWYESAFSRQNRNGYTILMHRKHFGANEKMVWVTPFSGCRQML